MGSNAWEPDSVVGVLKALGFGEVLVLRIFSWFRDREAERVCALGGLGVVAQRGLGWKGGRGIQTPIF